MYLSFVYTCQFSAWVPSYRIAPTWPNPSGAVHWREARGSKYLAPRSDWCKTRIKLNRETQSRRTRLLPRLRPTLHTLQLQNPVQHSLFVSLEPSPGQRRDNMDIYQLRASDNYPYFESLSNLCTGWLIPGQLDVQKFKGAVQKVVDKRPYLAGHMRRGEHGLYVQVKNTHFGFDVERRECLMSDILQYEKPDHIKLFKLNKTVLSNTIIPGSKALSFNSFLGSEDPLFKIHIVQCTDGFKLGMLMCHNLADGIGWGVILSEIKDALKGKDIGSPIKPTGHTDPFVSDSLVKQVDYTPGPHNVAHTKWSTTMFNAFLLGTKVAYDMYWHKRQLVEMYIPIKILRSWQAAAKDANPGTLVSRHDVITAYLWKIRACESAPTTPCHVFWVADFRSLSFIECDKDASCNCVIENLTPAILAKDVLKMSLSELSAVVRQTTEKYRQPEVARRMLKTMLESGRTHTIYMETPSPTSQCLFLTNWTKANLCDLDISECVKGGGKSVRCMNNLSATEPNIINVDPDESARIKMSIRPSTIASIKKDPAFLL